MKTIVSQIKVNNELKNLGLDLTEPKEDGNDNEEQELEENFQNYQLKIDNYLQ